LGKFAIPKIPKTQTASVKPADVFFPTDQPGGHVLTVLLPQSQFGLQRFSELGLTLQPETQYPVVRVGT